MRRLLEKEGKSRFACESGVSRRCYIVISPGQLNGAIMTNIVRKLVKVLYLLVAVASYPVTRSLGASVSGGVLAWLCVVSGMVIRPRTLGYPIDELLADFWSMKRKHSEKRRPSLRT